MSIQIQSQSVTGKVLGGSNREPLIYASIGVTETTRGTISDEFGNFSLDVRDLPSNSVVRFSMIGYKSRSFSIEELLKKGNLIILDNQAYRLSEIVIKPSGKIRKIGNSGYSPYGGICGLAGVNVAQGYEIGTKLDLGDSRGKIESLHIRIHEQSYDSSLFRLHIRSLVKGIPDAELLSSDILFTLAEESGWIETNLGKYNLVFEGEIALSIEWIKVYGTNSKIHLKSGDTKYFTPVIFFSKKKVGCLYTKWGCEGKWSVTENQSPAFYVVIR